MDPVYVSLSLVSTFTGLATIFLIGAIRLSLDNLQTNIDNLLILYSSHVNTDRQDMDNSSDDDSSSLPPSNYYQNNHSEQSSNRLHVKFTVDSDEIDPSLLNIGYSVNSTGTKESFANAMMSVGEVLHTYMKTVSNNVDVDNFEQKVPCEKQSKTTGIDIGLYPKGESFYRSADTEPKDSNPQKISIDENPSSLLETLLSETEPKETLANVSQEQSDYTTLGKFDEKKGYFPKAANGRYATLGEVRERASTAKRSNTDYES